MRAKKNVKEIRQAGGNTTSGRKYYYYYLHDQAGLVALLSHHASGIMHTCGMMLLCHIVEVRVDKGKG